MKSLKVLKSQEEIKKRIDEMGRELTKKFKGCEPVAICVLQGSFVFFSDLIRSLDIDVTCEFLAVSSYKDQKVSSGEVKITLDIDSPLEGKDVILIEDLVDSGLTMNYLIRNINAHNPKSLTTVALLDKPTAHKVDCHLDLVGFEIGTDFVVGYGIDFAGNYRNLPYLAIHT